MSDIKIGDTFRYYDANVTVVATGSPADAFPVRNGEIGIRAASRADAETLGWALCTNGEYEAIHTLAGFLEVAKPTTAPQDHGPLAAHLSDRTLAKVLSRPAYDPPSPTKDAIVEAALRWHAIRNANTEDVTPLALFDADDALHMAVKAHHAAVTS